ncbi:MAG: hypothetical protein H6660_00210 [Ardenticatenaceae bacterium]|nr:hypothetical protein [Ardenticatenaceae bacterium]
MSATAIYLAGLIYHAVLAIFDNNLIIGTMLAWLAAAVVNDQVNLWLLIGLLHLQSGVKPLDIWRQHRWAIPINVLVISVGGGVLAFAVAEFDIIGIGIFFCPSSFLLTPSVSMLSRQSNRWNIWKSWWRNERATWKKANGIWQAPTMIWLP